jgi:hypothetical protein
MPEELYRSNLRQIEDAKKTGATELRLEYIECTKSLLKIFQKRFMAACIGTNVMKKCAIIKI